MLCAGWSGHLVSAWKGKRHCLCSPDIEADVTVQVKAGDGKAAEEQRVAIQELQQKVKRSKDELKRHLLEAQIRLQDLTRFDQI